MFRVAVKRDQQRFIDLPRVQVKFARRLVPKTGFLSVMLIGMKGKGDLLFFQQFYGRRHKLLLIGKIPFLN